MDSVQTDRLHEYVISHLRSIIGISLIDKVSNNEVLRRAGLLSLKSIFIQINLRWLGHLERMGHERLPDRSCITSFMKEREVQTAA